MHDDQDPNPSTQTDQEEPILSARVFRIGHEKRLFIRKHRCRLAERDPMLSAGRRVLSRIPLKARLGHPRMITTMYLPVKVRQYA